MSYRDLYRWLFLMPLGFFLTMGLFLAFIISPAGAIVRACPDNRMTGAERRIVYLDKELERFHKDMNQRRVILGASYAACIGPIQDAYNFAFRGLSPKEADLFITHHCRPSDTIFYVVTLHDTMSTEVRPEYKQVLFSPVRRLQIAKTILREPFARPAPAYLSQEQLAKAHNYRYQSLKGTASIDSLLAVYQKHPNVVFVLFPFVSFSNDVATSHRRFKHLMFKADIPVIDMSDMLAPTDFRDSVHITGPANDRVRKRLIPFVHNYPTESLYVAKSCNVEIAGNGCVAAAYVQ